MNQQKLTAMETPIMTEPMEQYLMAGTNGYVLVLPDKTTQQLSGDYIRLAMKLKNNGYPELKNELRKFLNSKKWTPEIQPGREFPKKIMLNVSVKAWGVANSLTGFTVLSFCGLYLSIIFIILSCAVLAFEQLSAIDKNRKNYKVLAQLGVGNEKQNALARKELSTVFFIPLFFPIVFIVLLIIGIHLFYGKEILQQGLVLIYGIATILIFGVIYLIYFIATLFLFKRVIL